MSSNAPLVGSPAHQPKTKGDLLREGVVKWADWGITHHDRFHYTQGAARDDFLSYPVGAVPVEVTTDCSGFVTFCARQAGAGDPNGLGYRAVGFTGTLLKHCNHIATLDARFADLFVFGPGTGDHAVVVTEALPHGDFWLASHGHEGAPERVLFSVMDTYFHHVHQALRWLG